MKTSLNARPDPSTEEGRRVHLFTERGVWRNPYEVEQHLVRAADGDVMASQGLQKQMSSRHMVKDLAMVVIAAALFVGCHNPDSEESSDSSNLSESLDAEQLGASPGVRQALKRLESLIDRYNRDGYGVKLSEHGINGNLSDQNAKEIARNANKLLAEINGIFDRPVCRLIEAQWYQVPSRFRLTVQNTRSIRDQYPNCFTISHQDCGLYEFDFVVNVDGSAKVVGERYNDLGGLW